MDKVSTSLLIIAMIKRSFRLCIFYIYIIAKCTYIVKCGNEIYTVITFRQSKKTAGTKALIARSVFIVSNFSTHKRLTALRRSENYNLHYDVFIALIPAFKGKVNARILPVRFINLFIIFIKGQLLFCGFFRPFTPLQGKVVS